MYVSLEYTRNKRNIEVVETFKLFIEESKACGSFKNKGESRIDN